MTGLAAARSLLFVPGDRSERFDRAAASGADAVVIDLEDGVPPEAREAARASAANWLAEGNRAIVRVNARHTVHFTADCDALAGLPGLIGVMLPKAEEPADLVALRDAFGPGMHLVALVETARGIVNCAAIARTPGAGRLALGTVDLASDLGCEESREAMAVPRAQLVLASRAAGLPGPVDGVTRSLDDDGQVASDSRYARSLGFTGKLCIHPRQVDQVHDGFRPTRAQLDWARAVVEAAAGEGAQRIAGEMVDAPVMARARWTIEQAQVDHEEAPQ